MRSVAALFLILLLSGPGAALSDEASEANQQYQTLYKQGRYADAVPFAEKTLKLKENNLEEDHPKVAASLINLANLYMKLGRYSEAEPLLKRSLVIREKALGADHPKFAGSLNKIAELYLLQGRYDGVEPLFKRALAIRENALGANHTGVAAILKTFAQLYLLQGRYPDAETLLKRGLAIEEKALGADNLAVATSLKTLSELYMKQGRYSDAEPLFKRSLAIREKALGPNHPGVAQGLNNLAKLYLRQGRYDVAGPLLKRALTIREKVLGEDHRAVAGNLKALAELYLKQGLFADAEPFIKRGLAIEEKTLEADHPAIAGSLNKLAGLYLGQDRYEAAGPLVKRALAIWEKALGKDHRAVALSLKTLAVLYLKQGRYADAEPLFKRALAIEKKALGPDHPALAVSLIRLAGLNRKQRRNVAALDYIRGASAIYRSRVGSAGGQHSSGGLSERKKVRGIFVHHVQIAWLVARGKPSRRAALRDEGFEAGQLARATGAAAAVTGMGARFAAGDGALSHVVRARQDAVKQWRRTDNKLTDAAGLPPEKRDEDAERRLSAQLMKLDNKLKALDGRLNAEFPEYAELASPKPLALAEAQGLLGPGEALLAYLAGDKFTYLWVARKNRARIFRLDIGGEALGEAVINLRSGLDPNGIIGISDIPAFDTARAFELYGRIFAAAEPLLDGVRHLFVVPDGALQSLPLGVLVTGKTEGEIADFSAYRQVPWLARKYAMTTLPSVSSLRALRRFAGSARAKKPFAGFGDPLLQGHPGKNRAVELASLFTSRGIADVYAVRTQLPPLPDTADELEAMARILDAGKADLFLRERATESRIKAENLNKYRVLAFATHGLVAGDLEGLAEPALVLTPPRVGTEQDDGLLTASEVATLKLNADLVVLSACNTASADGSPNAEALSGLAKAFFYAGSRSLLVSHWQVGSDAAVKLTTAMLNEAANDNTVGRAEALRRSMLALMENSAKPYYAHPMFWAPFVVVGEGGAFAVN